MNKKYMRLIIALVLVVVFLLAYEDINIKHKEELGLLEEELEKETTKSLEEKKDLLKEKRELQKELEEKIANLEEEGKAKEDELKTLKNKNDELSGEIRELKKDNASRGGRGRSVAKDNAKSNNKPDLGVGKKGKLLGTFVATAYDDSPESQGKWVGKTASGMKPQVGVIAVDPKVIPLGTKLYVEGYGNCIAGDTGGAIKGRRVDLFMNTRKECYNWGRKSVKVYLRE